MSGWSIRSSYIKHPGRAVGAIYRAALAANGHGMRYTVQGIELAPDPNAMRCPVTNCGATPQLVDNIDMTFRRADPVDVSASWYCPDCGVEFTTRIQSTGVVA